MVVQAAPCAAHELEDVTGAALHLPQPHLHSTQSHTLARPVILLVLKVGWECSLFSAVSHQPIPHILCMACTYGMQLLRNIL